MDSARGVVRGMAGDRGGNSHRGLFIPCVQRGEDAGGVADSGTVRERWSMMTTRR